jgi:cysteine desulfurase/selenocysteine lyase
MDVKKIREDFPTTKELNFLATCGASPPLKPMLEAIRKAWDEKAYEGRILCGTAGMLQLMEEGRRHAARIIGAEKEEVAFVRGNNDAMNIIASMLDWKRGDNVILNDMEYAGGVVPWMRQKRRHGVEVKCVKSREGAVPLSGIEEAIDEHTKVISICHVHTANGYRNDLEALGKIAGEHGVYLVVNTSQSLGAVEIDVRRMNIDFVTCSAYKWALGPPGTGLMYVREELINRFEPPFVGIGQEERSIVEPDFNYHEYSPENLARTARRFEYGGHQMATGIIGLVEALKYIDNVGMDEIAPRNAMLFDHAVKLLGELDVELSPWIEDRSCRGSHLGFSADIPAKTIYESLRERKILTIPRMGYTGRELVRVAPHFFNTKEEIEELAEALAALL